MEVDVLFGGDGMPSWVAGVKRQRCNVVITFLFTAQGLCVSVLISGGPSPTAPLKPNPGLEWATRGSEAPAIRENESGRPAWRR